MKAETKPERRHEDGGKDGGAHVGQVWDLDDALEELFFSGSVEELREADEQLPEALPVSQQDVRSHAAVQLEEQPHTEVKKEAAVQDERDERGQPALTGRGGGLGLIGVHLTENRLSHLQSSVHVIQQLVGHVHHSGHVRPGLPLQGLVAGLQVGRNHFVLHMEIHFMSEISGVQSHDVTVAVMQVSPEDAHVLHRPAVPVAVPHRVAVSSSQHFVQQVAELPADHGVAGQRQVEDVGPEGGGSALLVAAQDDVADIFLLRWTFSCGDDFGDAVELLLPELLPLRGHGLLRLVASAPGFAHSGRSSHVWTLEDSRSSAHLCSCS